MAETTLSARAYLEFLDDVLQRPRELGMSRVRTCANTVVARMVGSQVGFYGFPDGKHIRLFLYGPPPAVKTALETLKHYPIPRDNFE